MLGFLARVRRALAFRRSRGVPLAPMPRRDPAILERRSSGVRTLIEQAWIIHDALISEIRTIESRARRRGPLVSWLLGRFDSTERTDLRAQGAEAVAAGLIADFVGQVNVLPMEDRRTLQSRGFGAARMNALLWLVATPVPDDARVDDVPPSSLPLRRAANELAELVRSFGQPEADDPYR